MRGIHRIVVPIATLGMALTLAFVLAAAQPARSQGANKQMAQAGSTGGAIGKRGKSASGGISNTKKPAAAPRKPDQRTRSRARRPKRAVRHRASISGRWHLKLKCSSGFFDVTVTLKQTSATDFNGSGIGQTTGAKTTITGHISDGNSFTWVRKGLVAVRGGGTFSGNRMRGNERGPVWTCKFTGRRR